MDQFDEMDVTQSMAAKTEDSPVGQTRVFGLLGSAKDGELLPGWHGAWRYNFAENSVDTAVVGLNLILAIGWRLLCWARHGGLNVSNDPRQAFVDGMNEGHRNALIELPADVLARHNDSVNRYSEAHKLANLYAPHLSMKLQLERFVMVAKIESAKGKAIPMHVLVALEAMLAKVYGEAGIATTAKIPDGSTTPAA